MELNHHVTTQSIHRVNPKCPVATYTLSSDFLHLPEYPPSSQREKEK